MTPPRAARRTWRAGAVLIAEERRRQVKIGFTSDHDDAHDGVADLVLAAECYLTSGCSSPEMPPPHRWPWEASWWKPTPNDRVRSLVKAGALIAAEIDRIQRRDARAVRPVRKPRAGKRGGR